MFSICCVPVSAEKIDLPSYVVTAYSYWKPNNSLGSTQINAFSFTPHDGNQEVSDGFKTNIPLAGSSGVVGYIDTEYYIAFKDHSSMFSEGKQADIVLENIYDSMKFIRPSSGESWTTFDQATSVSLAIWYADNTLDYASAEIVHLGDGVYHIESSFTPDKDVRQLLFTVRQTFTWNHLRDLVDYNGTNYYTSIERNLGEIWKDGTFNLVVEQPTNEETLLGGILDSLTSGLANVFQAIIDLPAKIWEFIENGLKALFVPDEDYIAGYKDKWEQLLADRLGAVYQVVQITFGAWEDIGTADERNSVSVPNVTIPLPDDCSFSFGGYDVQIVPDGFSGIVETLKLIVGIACTFLFVNGLRKRYDEVMGVEK